ncbi:hypothetical protein SLS55_010425 [Diplodia seriata]|uniref:Uncharacterized protein n=1 Tax=Diplodia seriata TaxID=420778 RepID=A0ABR3C101_9PEZI
MPTSTARFRLGKTEERKETIWKNTTGWKEDSVPEKQLRIYETKILDSRSNEVGRVVPHDHLRLLDTTLYYDFIVISESQYIGNEKRVDVPGFPLYNVMMVDWDASQPLIATRVALGKLYKRAWADAGPVERTVVLG